MGALGRSNFKLDRSLINGDVEDKYIYGDYEKTFKPMILALIDELKKVKN